MIEMTEEEINAHIENAREQLADMQILIDKGWEPKKSATRQHIALMRRIDDLERKLDGCEND